MTTISDSAARTGPDRARGRPRARLQAYLTRHHLIRALGAGLAAGLAAFALHAAGALEPVERVSYDARVRAAPRASRSELVEIIEVDQRTLDVLGPTWGRFGTWPRHKLCGLLAKALADHGARAIVLDFLLDYPASAEEDELLARLLAEAKRVAIPVQLYESHEARKGSARAGPGYTGPVTEGVPGPTYQAAAWPLHVDTEELHADVASAVAAIGAANVPLDPDGVMRRSQPVARFAGRSVWSLAAAGVWVARDRAAVPETGLRGHLVAWRGDPFDPERFHRETFHSVWMTILHERKPERYPATGLDLERYRGKVVVIGGTAQATYDHLATPFGDRPGLVAHAVAIENLLEGRAVQRSGAPAALAACLALGVLCALAVARHRRVWLGALAAAAVLAAYGLLGWGLLAWRNLWLDLAAPEAAGLLGVTVSGVVGYMVEGRRVRRFRVAFGRHLSPQVAGEIERNFDTVRPGTCARRRLAVLFADIRNFTTLSEGSTPEAVVEILNEYMGPMSEAILEARGTLNKYLGDGIMAFWGAPQGLEKPAALALCGAREMLRALARLQEAWRARGRPVLEIGIGLHVGDAVVGVVGDERRAEYTAIGDTVNLAARLEPQTKVFGVRVLVSEAVVEAAPDAARYRRLGTIQVKGRTGPVTVYEAVFPEEG